MVSRRGYGLAAVIAAGLLPAVGPSKVDAYPIDCAILLCLSGGWPGSVECTAARAEFVRRITPWPIEPPLQIWRCPMRASFRTQSPVDRIWSIAATALPGQSQMPEGRLPWDLAVEVAGSPAADVDISDPAFDVVRSIRVYDIDWYAFAGTTSNGERDVCHRQKARTRLGSYGQQGDFSWAGFSITAAPAWLDTNLHPDGPCIAAGRYRGVGVEWTDTFGTHGFEVVRY
ncbi:hypothetical protein FNJ84_19790 [Paracoccus sp. M683]|nr:hypothetical protein FNJ84_19790 [Paracoccus sp. M683]